MFKLILKISSVVALSAFKFLGGAPLALAYKLSFFQTVIYTTIGGICGVFLIIYFSKTINNLWNKINIFAAKKPTEQIYHEEDIDVDLEVGVKYYYKETVVATKKKIFTQRNRMVVKMKNKYGLIGIAVLTPVFLSIPIGTFIATKFFHNKKKIILYMTVSIVFWSFVLAAAFGTVIN